MSKSKAATSSRPAIVIPILLVIAIGVLIVLLPCPSEAQFIFFKMVLALTAGLFGWFIAGFVQVRAKLAGLAIRAGGGGAFFVVALVYSPQLSTNSARCAPLYTIILRDSTGRSIEGLKGTLNVQIGPNVQAFEIKSDGMVDIKGITENKEQYKFRLELKAGPWVFVANRRPVLDTTFKGSNLNLNLTLSDEYCCITGIVYDADSPGRGLPGADVYIDGHKLSTGEDGRFSYPVAVAERSAMKLMRIEKDSFRAFEKAVTVTSPGEPGISVFLYRNNTR